VPRLLPSGRSSSSCDCVLGWLIDAFGTPLALGF
jgi:hypothetical protein